jgi:hypothetical protein
LLWDDEWAPGVSTSVVGPKLVPTVARWGLFAMERIVEHKTEEKESKRCTLDELMSLQMNALLCTDYWEKKKIEQNVTDAQLKLDTLNSTQLETANRSHFDCLLCRCLLLTGQSFKYDEYHILETDCHSFFSICLDNPLQDAQKRASIGLHHTFNIFDMEQMTPERFFDPAALV